MQDKKRETITKYLGDMKAVVHHVEEAMEKQAVEFKDHPDVTALVERIVTQLRAQRQALDSRLKELGGSPTNPVKEGVSSVAGVIAGLYDKIRTEGAAKALRDDHTALNFAYVSYMTLATTGIALGDRPTATVAERGMRECAQAAMDVQRLIPGIVVRELQDGDFGQLDPSAIEEARNATHEAWRGEGIETPIEAS